MPQVRCSICDAAMPGNRKDYPDYPFCSRRCRLVDLGRWLGEGYRIGGPDAAADDDRSTPADDADAPR